MPQIIEHIDAIARRKHRDVLYATFFEDGDRQAAATDWRQNKLVSTSSPG